MRVDAEFRMRYRQACGVLQHSRGSALRQLRLRLGATEAAGAMETWTSGAGPRSLRPLNRKNWGGPSQRFLRSAALVPPWAGWELPAPQAAPTPLARW
jgi:hypothetical protein